MALTSGTRAARTENSMDLVEQILDDADWSYERDGHDSVHCIVPTRWGDMCGIFCMSTEPESLQFSLTLDVKPTPPRRDELSELILRINDNLGPGHFDYWAGDDVVLFRQGIPMAGRNRPEDDEVSAIVDAATKAVNQYMPSMNYVIWAGKDAEDALGMANFQTIGEA